MSEKPVRKPPEIFLQQVLIDGILNGVQNPVSTRRADFKRNRYRYLTIMPSTEPGVGSMGGPISADDRTAGVWTA
jgi:hypothetical protein